MSELLVSRTLGELEERLGPLRRAGATVGLVPTMGALHEGHGALVRDAAARADVVVTSIFVNPTQFGPNEDFERYPRDLETDLRYLRELGCGHVWHPGVEEMYPPGFATRIEMSGLTERLCGRARPGHFSGVLTVVLKLLNQVRPDLAIFGQKDYQQAQVIRRMVRDLDVPVAIVVHPIVREPDGLALSSRNRYLSTEERAEAPALRAALRAMDRAFHGGERAAHALLEVGRAVIASRPRFRIDYLEIVDPDDLDPRDGAVSPGDVVAVAAFLGKTRLIDNLLLGVEGER